MVSRWHGVATYMVITVVTHVEVSEFDQIFKWAVLTIDQMGTTFWAQMLFAVLQSHFCVVQIFSATNINGSRDNQLKEGPVDSLRLHPHHGNNRPWPWKGCSWMYYNNLGSLIHNLLTIPQRNKLQSLP